MRTVISQANAKKAAHDSANVPSGYKRTDLGVFPVDWDIRAISEVANVKTGPFGSSLHERDYVEDGTPIITVEHLSEFGILHTDLPMVSEPDRIRLKSYSLKKNDIVFSRVGSVDRNSLVTDAENGWLFSGRLLRVRVSDQAVVSIFLSYHFHSRPFIQRVYSVAVGQTMASLNTQILKAIPIVLPTPREQTAIATALSDVDNLLTALDKLIAKKQAIKQATMQQLLTGKTRLPGFSGEWAMKPLIDLAEITMGQSPSSQYYNSLGNGLPLIQGNADIKDRRTIERIWTSQANKRCNVGDIVLTVRAPVGAVCMASTDACLGRGVCGLKPFDSISFLFQALIFAEPHWRILEQGSTFTAANSMQVGKFHLPIPTDKKEQDAIAEILSDMDAEITASERRRDKTKAIKQGMMQELLTGRTRLI